MGNTNEENVKSPKGFYMKYEWYELFETMKPKQFHNVMMNSYNYLLGNELFKMNQSESQVFMFIIKPVLEHNKKVYADKCAHNASISRKGVEAKAAKNPIPYTPTQGAAKESKPFTCAYPIAPQGNPVNHCARASSAAIQQDANKACINQGFNFLCVYINNFKAAA